jgi:hypothetical protein
MAVADSFQGALPPEVRRFEGDNDCLVVVVAGLLGG